MYSDVFQMYPRARVGKPSDTIKIQHARCEYKRILAHEGSMTLRYKVPYTIQAKYKQDTVEYKCIHHSSAEKVPPPMYQRTKRCPARTVRHPKVIKGARHVPGPIRELTSLILHDHGPCTAPLTRS